MTVDWGSSVAIQRFAERLNRVAVTPLPILLMGETGTGKELAARALHERSERSGRFVPVDCAALSKDLVESELFGHKKGAFTGAHSDRMGLAAAAEGGTFFLDEIGELSLSAQVRLLRLLETGCYRPLGSETERKTDLRVVAATWRDLTSAVADGIFREDLYHRLSVVELRLPPLRERTADILPLFRRFVADARDVAIGEIELSEDVTARLLQSRWPGNVRELRNAASYAAALAAGPTLHVGDLPMALRRPGESDEGWQTDASIQVRFDLTYMEARRICLDEFQERYVRAVLRACDGNVSEAARTAGMDRRSIQRILKREA